MHEIMHSESNSQAAEAILQTQTHTDAQVHSGHSSKISKFSAHMLESSLY